jgi:hypothetical protein
MDLARTVQPLMYVLTPVLVYQGRGLRRRLPRLPEAADPSPHRSGHRPPVRLAVFGDSTAAGVGAKRHQDACRPACYSGQATRRQRSSSAFQRAIALLRLTTLTARRRPPQRRMTRSASAIPVAADGCGTLPFSAGLPDEHKIGRVSIAPGVAVLARSRCASRHVLGARDELAAAPGRAAKLTRTVALNRASQPHPVDMGDSSI